MLHHDSPRLEQVFAVVRLDRDMVEEFGLKTDFIVVKKVMRDQDGAEREVARLNALNADKGAVYFACTTRLERLPVASPAPTPEPHDGARGVVGDGAHTV